MVQLEVKPAWRGAALAEPPARRARLRRRRQSGQTLVLGVLTLAVLVGFLGVGIDFGLARHQQQVLQTVADSAAIGGAAELQYNDVSAGAQKAAALNNFVDGAGGATLTVNNPPLSGPHAGNAQYVEVIAALAQPTYFLNLFHISSLNLSARAVAYLGNGPGCLYALDPSAAGALRLNGAFNIQVQCGVFVDSSSNQALIANGSGSLIAKSVGVAGDALQNGVVTVSPAPQTGMAPVNDPLGYLTPPSTAGSCSSPTVVNGSGTVTLQPGVYCSTLILNGNPNVTFAAGTYVLEHGMVMNGNPTVTGSGVTFYNAAGSLTFNGTTGSNLSAPTTGAYAGILVYQSPADAAALTLNGNNNATLNGAIYVPGGNIVINGNAAVGAYSIMVADTITVNGSDSLNDDFSSLPAGSPVKAPVLVE